MSFLAPLSRLITYLVLSGGGYPNFVVNSFSRINSNISFSVFLGLFFFKFLTILFRSSPSKYFVSSKIVTSSSNESLKIILNYQLQNFEDVAHFEQNQYY